MEPRLNPTNPRPTYPNFISFYDGTTPKVTKNLGRSTDGCSSGLKFFKIILF